MGAELIQLFCEEIVSVIPRTGHMGVEEQGVGPCGEWVVYKPRRSVMDRIDAALAGVKLYRGKAAGGMAVFDAGFFLDGKETDGHGKLPDFEYLGTEGPTRKYLQRRVTQKLYPWEDLGAYRGDGTPGPPNVTEARLRQIRLLRAEFGIAQEMVGDRIALKVLSREVIAPWWPDERPTDLIEHPDKPVPRKRARPLTLPQYRMADGDGVWLMYGPSARQRETPADVCYLDNLYPWIAPRRPDKQFNSYDKFGDVTELKPKPQLMPPYRTPNYRNGRVIAVEYLRRSQDRKDRRHEIEILRRADAVQVAPGTSARRGRSITQAHDLPVSILSPSIARKVGT
jgi:hypothetical protein